MNDELSNEETEKVLQFQQLTAIEDISVCREILIRNNWNLELAFQEREQLNEGIPSIFASSQDIRAPAVINDRFLQHIFVRSNRNNVNNGMFGVFSYVVNSLLKWCFTTFTSFIETLLSIFTQRDPSKLQIKSISSTSTSIILINFIFIFTSSSWQST